MAQLMPLPFTVSGSRKSRMVLLLPFWCWVTPDCQNQLIPDKIQRAIK